MSGKRLCSFGMVILGELYALCTLTEGHQDGSNNPGRPTRLAGHSLLTTNGTRVNAPFLCGHCGRPCGNFEGGFAIVASVRVCHPNVKDRPDCYRLITVYNEVIGVRLNETQVGFQQTKAAQGILQRALVQSSARSQRVLPKTP